MRWLPSAFTKALLLVVCFVGAAQSQLSSAEPIPVHFEEGSVHGFLVIRSPDDKVIATGDLIQTTQRNRVKSHLVFRFKDGSVDDEIAIFSQRGYFRLIADHHIQKGPTFPDQTDLSINASTGQVIVRSEEKGKEKIYKEHLDLPPDVANGMILNVLKNIPPHAKETEVSYVTASPKPRLVKIVIAPAAEDTFTIAGSHHRATRFVARIQLGGLAGILAPLVGKQPADMQVWVVGGEAPAFVKSVGPLYLGGPVWTTEMSSPVWTRSSYSGQ